MKYNIKIVVYLCLIGRGEKCNFSAKKMLFYSKTKNVHQKTTPINITAYVTGPYILVNMELYFCNVNMVKIDFCGG